MIQIICWNFLIHLDRCQILRHLNCWKIPCHHKSAFVHYIDWPYFAQSQGVQDHQLVSLICQSEFQIQPKTMRSHCYLKGRNFHKETVDHWTNYSNLQLKLHHLSFLDSLCHLYISQTHLETRLSCWEILFSCNVFDVCLSLFEYWWKE